MIGTSQRRGCSTAMSWSVKSVLAAVARRPARRASRGLALTVSLLITLLLLYNWLYYRSPAETARLHKVAFSRQYGWLQSRSLRSYVLPGRISSLLQPRCAASAADTAPLLAAVVTSAPGHAAARRAIRRSWGRRTTEVATRTVFLVGLPPDEQTQAALAAESAEYGDILQEPFVEHYQNLTIKSVFMLKWLAASRCADAPFALKVDDDIWVDMPALLNSLRLCARPGGACADDAPLVAGRLYPGVTAYRGTASKYYLPPQLLADDTLPDFVSGTAYVMTRSAVDRLYRQALDTPFINLEDVYVTGLVAPRAGVRLLPTAGFQKARPLWVHPCTCRGYLTVHGLTPDQLEWIQSDRKRPCGRMWAVVNWLMPWVL